MRRRVAGASMGAVEWGKCRIRGVSWTMLVGVEERGFVKGGMACLVQSGSSFLVRWTWPRLCWGGGQLLWARAQQWLEWEAGYVDPEGSGQCFGEGG